MSNIENSRKELLEAFRRSTQDRLEKITLAWIALEKSPQAKELADELLRQLHTLKGEAKMMGFADISLIAHRTETVVILARKKSFDVPADFGDLVLAGCDTMGALIHKRAGSDQSGLDLSPLIDRFEQTTALLSATATQAEAERAAVPVVRSAYGSASSIDTDSFLRMSVDVVASFVGAAEDMVVSHSRHEHVLSKLAVLKQEIEQERAAGEFGRFVHGRLAEIIRSVDEEMHESGLRARELEYRARQMRLVPASSLLNKYVRAVRDLAAEHGKIVTVQVRDKNVSIDKNISDRLADPLLHLVRNSVDHGIEAPEERKKQGKAPEACIQLTADYDGSFVIIAIEDDGRGIDLAAVRDRTVELGLVSLQQAADLHDEAILSFIFSPGFTMRRVVSEVSGRGIGLDAVRRQVELLGGTVRVGTELGKRTRFELRAPITVALTRVLVVSTPAGTCVIPSRSV